MKTGLSLTELARRIEANKTMKQDFVAPTRAMEMAADSDGVHSLIVGDHGRFPILQPAHEQIAGRLDIPRKYYDRMKEAAPALLQANVNTWLKRSPDRRMIRTLGGDTRAFLSDRYHRIENEEIAEVALPILFDIPDVQIVSCEVTDRRMYISAVSPRLQGDVKVGDTVQAGVMITNSETGFGAVSVRPMIYRLVCLNGMTIPDARFSARHVGRQIMEGEALNAIFQDDTKRADDRAVLLKVRDVVRAAVDEAAFRKRLESMTALTEGKIEGDPSKAVEVLAKKVGATEGERGGILRSLIEGGDLSAWGMLNAVTHQAHKAVSYDRSIDFVEAGGALLNLPKSEWREILRAE